MCDICLKTICPPQCPNAEQPPRVFICSGCGDDICEGDDYWEIMGEQWCETCMDDAKHVAEFYYDDESDWHTESLT